jgi:serine/threonine protein kinase
MKKRKAKDEGVSGDLFVPVAKGTEVCGGYRVQGKLGQGAYGRVFKVTKNGKEYAAKQLIIKRGALDEDIIKEIDLLHRLRHEGIMHSIATDFIPKITCIVGEVMSGDLRKFMEERNTYAPSFFTDHAKTIWIQVLKGLTYLHHNFVIHQDIKPDNILYKLSPDGDMEARIADYGLAVITPSSGKVPYMTTVITSWWRPPELLAWGAKKAFKRLPVDNQVMFFYGNEVDVYSMGVVGMELFFGVHPPYMREKEDDFWILGERGSFAGEGFELRDDLQMTYNVMAYERHANDFFHVDRRNGGGIFESLLRMVDEPKFRPRSFDSLEMFESLFKVPKSKKSDFKISFQHFEIDPIPGPTEEELIAADQLSVREDAFEHVKEIVPNFRRFGIDGAYLEQALMIQTMDLFDRIMSLPEFSPDQAPYYAALSMYITACLMVPGGAPIGKFFPDLATPKQQEPLKKDVFKIIKATGGTLFRPSLAHMNIMTSNENMIFVSEHLTPSSISIEGITR